MYTKISFFLLVALISISSCKTVKEHTPESFEGQMLTFGTQGGFAGTLSEHYIFENGQFLYHTSRANFNQPMKNLESNLVKQLFSNFETLGFSKLDINDPGNLTYFLKLKNNDTEHVIKWGGNNEEIPQVLRQYFKNLSLIAKSHQIVEKQ